MKRSILALALASFSIVAPAADKPLPVTVTNPVLPVEVSNADPILVRDADNPARIPVTETVTFSDTYTVPAGKRLVIEYVSGEASTSGAGNSVFSAGVVTGNTKGSTLFSYYHRFPVTLVVDTGAAKSYVFSQLTRLYSDEGSEVHGSYSYNGSGSPIVLVTFAGYLVDM